MSGLDVLPYASRSLFVTCLLALKPILPSIRQASTIRRDTRSTYVRHQPRHALKVVQARRSDRERVLIGDGLRSGATMTQIAADLGRATSTITREAHRNSDESGA